MATIERGWRRLLAGDRHRLPPSRGAASLPRGRADRGGRRRAARPRLRARAGRPGAADVHAARPQPRAQLRGGRRLDGLRARAGPAVRARGRRPARRDVRRLLPLHEARAGLRRLRHRRRPRRRAQRPAARFASPRHAARAADAHRQALRRLAGLAARRARLARDGRAWCSAARTRWHARRRSTPSSTSTRRCSTTGACSTRCSPTRAPDSPRSSRRSCSWARCRRPRSPPRSCSRRPRHSPASTLAQLVRPGTPVVLGSFLSHTDMQSGSPGFGGPESAIGLFCSGQIARRLGLPWRSGGGALTSSQVPDAQAAVRGPQHDAPGLPGRRELRPAHGGLARVWPRVLLREARRSTSRSCARCARSSRRSRWTRPRWPTARTRRSATAATSSAPSTRWSASATASTGRCSPAPRTTSAGCATAAATAPSVRRRSGSAALERYEQPPMDSALRAELEEFVTRRRTELGD